MNYEKATGIPSIDRPWMKYYPKEVSYLQVPNCTLLQYLKNNCYDESLTVIHYYGNDIPWSDFFRNVDAVARSLRAIGFQEGDQIPVFLRAVPEFFYLLLGAEKIGASLLCRDNTLEENVTAVKKSNSKVIFAHDFLSQNEKNAFVSGSNTEMTVLVSPLCSGDYEQMPDHIRASLNSLYHASPAQGSDVLTWEKFLSLGRYYIGPVDAPVDIDRPLFRAYTSGSTGPSKQVIHSAHSMLGVICQMNPGYVPGSPRPIAMHTILPPSLVAVVVSMTLVPMASNSVLVLDPFCDPKDVDLELMRYKPNTWPMIPMFCEQIVRGGRIPDDYDLSHLLSAGLGCESYNNHQVNTAQQFLYDHNCQTRFVTGYGSSESGSSICMPMTPHPTADGKSGIPLPLNIISIFKPGTQEELSYNEFGEICVCGPGNMLCYDDPAATAKTLQKHPDGKVWLHMGDLGYMNEDGCIYVLTRGHAPRYDFENSDLATLSMENRVADSCIEGISDEFFVNVPDKDHEGYYLPYLYVVLEDGYTVDHIADEVRNCLDPYMYPIDIIQLDKRPFFHFKTNRIGLIRELQERNIGA